MGLAHFLEHMLFLGTEKFPDENSYNAYLSAHGGGSNAYTDQDHTNYYFDVNQEHLEGALDRFAQFFIAPLFTEGATDREMNAVDSEHAKNVQSDMWRFFQLYKETARPDHPFNKFSTGNLETLRDQPKEKGVDIRQELLAFHARWYSANIMRLVVLGREPLDELQALVLRLFSGVENKEVVLPTFPGAPYGPEQLGQELRAVPVRDNRTVELSFPLPEMRSRWRAQPTRYLSHLVGHESEGSVLALLKEKGWANSLSAGSSRSLPDWSSFAISVDATEAGMEHVDEIVTIIFQYLNMLKAHGPEEWVWAETRQVAEVDFRFRSKRPPMDYVSGVAWSMQLYPPGLELSGSSLLRDYDPALISETLSRLSPENCVLFTAAKSYEGATDRVGLWYRTPYSKVPLDAARAAAWGACGVNTALRLPDRNPFLAEDFDLRPLAEPKKYPSLLWSDARGKAWHKHDDTFKQPKGNVLIKIDTPVAYESAEANVLTRLLVRMVKEKLNKLSYMAECASLYYSLDAAREGVQAQVCGYSHKLPELLAQVLKELRGFSPDPAEGGEDARLFARLKEKEDKSLRNQRFSQPYQHAMLNASLCTEHPRFGYLEKIEALAPLTLEHLAGFSRRLFARFSLEALVHGNLSRDEAAALAEAAAATLAPARGPLPEGVDLDPRLVKGEGGAGYLHRAACPDPDNGNSAVQIFYTTGPETLETAARVELLAHLLREPAFNQLRTQEQLGYLVFSGTLPEDLYITGVRFIIQSDSKDAAYLDDRVEAFLSQYRETLRGLDPEEFQKNVEAVKEDILEKDKNLNEESSRHWRQIRMGSYFFDRAPALAERVATLTHGEIITFFETYLLASSPHRVKFSAQVFGNQHPVPAAAPPAGTVLVEDPAAFRRAMPLHPLRPRASVAHL